MVAISVDMPPEEALAAVIDSPFTRYPVYRGSVDEILGILHVRDLFKALYGDGIENVRIEEILRPAYFVPETKDLAALLAEFRKTNQHMAIVVDEYGATEGIVTLENVLEEIVGEIEDEYDLPDEDFERLDEHRILVDGTFPIDDFNEEFHQELPQEDYHTVAGFVFGELGRAAGDRRRGGLGRAAIRRDRDRRAADREARGGVPRRQRPRRRGARRADGLAVRGPLYSGPIVAQQP